MKYKNYSSDALVFNLWHPAVTSRARPLSSWLCATNLKRWCTLSITPAVLINGIYYSLWEHYIIIALIFFLRGVIYDFSLLKIKEFSYWKPKRWSLQIKILLHVPHSVERLSPKIDFCDVNPPLNFRHNELYKGVRLEELIVSLFWWCVDWRLEATWPLNLYC